MPLPVAIPGTGVVFHDGTGPVLLPREHVVPWVMSQRYFGPIGATNIADGYALDGSPQHRHDGPRSLRRDACGAGSQADMVRHAGLPCLALGSRQALHAGVRRRVALKRAAERAVGRGQAPHAEHRGGVADRRTPMALGVRGALDARVGRRVACLVQGTVYGLKALHTLSGSRVAIAVRWLARRVVRAGSRHRGVHAAGAGGSRVLADRLVAALARPIVGRPAVLRCSTGRTGRAGGARRTG